MKTTAGYFWNAERDAELTRLWALKPDVTMREIHEALGCSLYCVYARARGLGLRVVKRRGADGYRRPNKKVGPTKPRHCLKCRDPFAAEAGMFVCDNCKKGREWTAGAGLSDMQLQAPAGRSGGNLW